MIKNGEAWMSALDSRDSMPHTYDLKKFEQIILKIARDYFLEIENMYLTMLNLAKEEEIISKQIEQKNA